MIGPRGTVGLLGVGLLAAGCATTTPQEQDQLRAQVGGLQAQVAALNSQVEELRMRQRALEERAWDHGARPAPIGAARLSPGMPSRRVLTAREIQQALKNAGDYDGPVDGKIGPQTRVAIKAFQSSHQLTADGVAGAKTMAALETYLTEAEAPTRAGEEFP